MKYFDVPALSRLVLRLHLILFLSLALVPKLAAQQVIFSDGFENGLNGWLAADNNIDPPGIPSYWGVVDSAFGGEGTHGGTNKAYCAAVGYLTTTGPCCPNYRENMAATLSRTINLTGYTNATLSFWYTMPSVEGPRSRYSSSSNASWSKPS
jgi:hypothetical protein